MPRKKDTISWFFGTKTPPKKKETAKRARPNRYKNLDNVFRRLSYSREDRIRELQAKVQNLLDNSENLSEDQIKQLREVQGRLILLSSKIDIIQKDISEQKEAVEKLSKMSFIEGAKDDPMLLIMDLATKFFSLKSRKRLEISEDRAKGELSKVKAELEEIAKQIKDISRQAKKEKTTANKPSGETAAKPGRRPDDKEPPEPPAPVLPVPKPPGPPPPPEAISKSPNTAGVVLDESIKNLNETIQKLIELLKQTPEKKRAVRTFTVTEKTPEETYKEEQANLLKKTNISERINELQASVDELKEMRKEISLPIPVPVEDDDSRELLRLIDRVDANAVKNNEELVKELKEIEKLLNEQNEMKKDELYEKKDADTVQTEIQRQKILDEKVLRLREEISKGVIQGIAKQTELQQAAEGRGGLSTGKIVGGAVAGAGGGAIAAKTIPKVWDKISGKGTSKVATEVAKEGAEEVVEQGAKAGGRLAKGAKVLGKVGKVSKVAPLVGTALYAGGQIIEGKEKGESTGKIVAKTAGGLAGGLAGAKLGAVIGTAIAPGIGTAVGAGAGGLLGGLIGTLTGENVAGALYDKFFGQPEYKEVKPIDRKTPAAGKDSLSQVQVKEESQLADLQEVLGKNLAGPAAQMAITEGGYDKKTRKLKTDTINKESQAAGMFQFLPSTAVEMASKVEDQALKEKFKPYIEQVQKKKPLDREGVAKLVASLSVKEQAQLYKKFIEPLVKKYGEENITADMLKSYGFAPAIHTTNKKSEDVVYKKGTQAYELNKMLDPDKSGEVTKQEIEDVSEKIIEKSTTPFEDFIGANTIPKPGEERVVVAKREETIPIPPSRRSLIRESAARQEQQAAVQQPVQVALNNQTVNNINPPSGNNERGNPVNTRNVDPIYQKSLEKSFFG